MTNTFTYTHTHIMRNAITRREVVLVVARNQKHGTALSLYTYILRYPGDVSEVGCVARNRARKHIAAPWI